MIIGINGKIGSGKDTVGKIIQHLTSEWADEKFQDTDMLDVRSNWEIKKFAGKLKTIASILTGIPVENFEYQEFKKSLLGPEWGAVKENPLNSVTPFSHVEFNHLMTVRELLQKLGTEAMRDGLHTNVWVNALFADYKHIWNDPDPIEGNDYNITYRKDCPDTEESLIQYGGGSEAEVFTREIEQSKWIITDMRFPNEMEAVVEKGGITIRVTRPGTATGTHPSEIALDDAEFNYEIINDGTLEDLTEKVRQILIKENIL